MHTADEIRNASPPGEPLRSLTEEEMREALIFLSGWTPEGVAAALNCVERARAWRAEAGRTS